MLGSTGVHPLPQTRTKPPPTSFHRFKTAKIPPCNFPFFRLKYKKCESRPLAKLKHKNSLGAGRTGGVCRTRSSCRTDRATTTAAAAAGVVCEARRPIMRPGAHVASQTDCIDRRLTTATHTIHARGPPFFGRRAPLWIFGRARRYVIPFPAYSSGRNSKQEI